MYDEKIDISVIYFERWKNVALLLHNCLLRSSAMLSLNRNKQYTCSVQATRLSAVKNRRFVKFT